MAKLILIRHGKSAWNHLGLWTGWTDVDLVEEGRMQARSAADALKDMPIHMIHVSALKRAHQTLEEIVSRLGIHHVPVVKSLALNERHYGIYTGKNKWDIQKEVGEAQFKHIRRGWDVPIPEGETLKDVYHRVMPYYDEYILPDIKAGKNVLVVAHGNSLRAMIKHVEDIHEDDIADVELETGEVRMYDLDHHGMVQGKESF